MRRQCCLAEIQPANSHQDMVIMLVKKLVIKGMMMTTNTMLMFLTVVTATKTMLMMMNLFAYQPILTAPCQDVGQRAGAEAAQRLSHLLICLNYADLSIC